MYQINNLCQNEGAALREIRTKPATGPVKTGWDQMYPDFVYVDVFGSRRQPPTSIPYRWTVGNSCEAEGRA